MLFLPTRTDLPRYSFSIELEGRDYLLALDWNDRDSAWYMSVSTGDAVPVVSGIALRLGALVLGKRIRGETLPPGDFILYDTSDSNVDPGLSDLGERVKLVYLTSDEV